ncbi:MAG: hypothetical protein HQL64_00260 [Magnetococcales bacterium]|nr:hypothetical protein [Magnetococcales bacterium]
MVAESPSIPPPGKSKPNSRLRPIVSLPLLILAAFLVLFEEFVWNRITQLMTILSRLRLLARLERWMSGLTPYQTLALFAIPILALIPVKILAFYLLARGQVVSGVLLIVAAKTVGTAISAKLLVIAKPKLLTFPLFVWAYDKANALKEWAHDLLADLWLLRLMRTFRATLKTCIGYFKVRAHMFWLNGSMVVRRWWRGWWR